MKKLIYLTLLCLSAQLHSQAFENEVGVKAGFSSGLTLAHSLNKHYIVELQALYNNKGFQTSGIYKYQFSPYDKKQLYYFFGAGIYGGNWENENAIGGTAILGTSYYLRKVPLAIGIEWKPMINFYKSFNFALPDIGVTFKVIIN